jgi:GGDEF domain-containing protein
MSRLSALILHGNEVKASTSIGISMSTTGYTGALSVLRDADRAMYAAWILILLA